MSQGILHLTRQGLTPETYVANVLTWEYAKDKQTFYICFGGVDDEGAFEGTCNLVGVSKWQFSGSGEFRYMVDGKVTPSKVNAQLSLQGSLLVLNGSWKDDGDRRDETYDLYIEIDNR